MAVVTAAHGAFAPLLGKLTALLADECGRLKGVRREIRSLRSELASMHAALKEYTKLEDPNEQVKAWISLVRELAYDTEDVFDRFIHHLGDGRDHGDGGFKDFFRKTVRHLKAFGSRKGIADQIDDLKVRINQVKELKDSYKLNDVPSSTSGHAAVDPRLHAVFVDEAHLVGMDGPRDDLSDWMLDSNNLSKDCKILSIVGFGGIGKTTLANEVYRKIQGYFDCHAFVSVSQKPDIKKIIKDLISQVRCQDGSSIDTSDFDERKCIAKLRGLLQDRRYLIVIDDVWSTQAWNTIKCAFPENNCSSGIIATTRIINVAKTCCSGDGDRMYELEALSDIYTRRLFNKKVFRSEEHCPDMLKEVSDKILKKCGGLPLAVISISGLLANRPATKEEWKKIKRSIGSALEKTKSLDGMSSILSLSYNDLAPNLKTCLLYLSLFPEDHIMERDKLVRRWIAEGFISEERGQSKQEVAENYFYELINKNMVQPVDIGYDGKVGACQVHDMMLEIIISKSAEVNFTTVVSGGQTSLANRQGFIRRLSIQYINSELASALAKEDLGHVRSLIVTPSCRIRQLPSLVRFEALRVLDFEDCKDLEDFDMNGMNKLFQLKYLSFRNTDITELPSGIVMLSNLETLDIRSTYVQEFPEGFNRLTKLRHLFGNKNEIPNGIGDMRKLQRMSGFVINLSGTDALEDLGTLTSLEELQVHLSTGIWESDEVSSEDKRCVHVFLSSLCKLGTYKLRCFEIDGHCAPLDFLDSWSPLPSSLQTFTASASANRPLKNIPKWITPALTNLADLHISLAELTEDGLLTLGKLPFLLHLAILSRNFVTGVQGISFPSLKVFSLSSSKGVYVTFMKGSMPKLENLMVSFDVSMAKTDGFYLGIEHLSCLKQAHIWLYNKGATPSEIKAAAAAIRKEGCANPNHPAVTLEGEPNEGDNKETGNGNAKTGTLPRYKIVTFPEWWAPLQLQELHFHRRR